MEKQYLCMHDVCPLSDTAVVRGDILDKGDRTKWNPVENSVVPAGSFIRAGSVVVKDEAKIKKELKLGMYLPADTSLHFDLESVFAGEMDFFDKRTSFADVLRAYGIKTLEQVAQNAMALRPLLDKKKGSMHAYEVVAWISGGDKEQYDAWIAQCKDIIGNGAD